MDKLLSNIRIEVPQGIYIKDPQTSALGQKIITGSIDLIDKIGFEAFTFKKLGVEIGSNESSIYRYFENKHKLLNYLSSWYWGWLEYRFVFETHNIEDKTQKLKKGIEVVTRTVQADSNFSFVDESMLNRIIINESSKSYLVKEVDLVNKEGYFETYKRLVKRLSDLIINVNPTYRAPLSLSSAIIENSLYQHFLKSHFKSITDCKENYKPSEFFIDLTLKVLS